MGLKVSVLVLLKGRAEDNEECADHEYDRNCESAFESECASVNKLLGRNEHCLENSCVCYIAADIYAVEVTLYKIPDAVDGTDKPDVSCSEEDYAGKYTE